MTTWGNSSHIQRTTWISLKASCFHTDQSSAFDLPCMNPFQFLHQHKFVTQLVKRHYRTSVYSHMMRWWEALVAVELGWPHLLSRNLPVFDAPKDHIQYNPIPPLRHNLKSAHPCNYLAMCKAILNLINNDMRQSVIYPRSWTPMLLAANSSSKGKHAICTPWFSSAGSGSLTRAMSLLNGAVLL